MQILLAVDSSPASMRAARETAARPWPSGTSVQVISIVEPIFGWDAPDLDEALHQSGRATVEQAADYLKAAGLETHTAVLTGDPKTLIAKEAEGLNIDLVVIGANSTHGVMQYLLGGVARAVARLATCSVEIVRRVPGPEPLSILLATDGSDCSNAAVRSVTARPWPEGTAFRILSIVEPSAPLLHPPYFSEKAMEAMLEKDMRRAQEAVAVAERIFCAAGIRASTIVAVPSATPKELILSEAAEWCADMIVVGSHGRRGMDRLLLGSVSEAVALHAQCSVEIIRRAALATDQGSSGHSRAPA